MNPPAILVVEDHKILSEVIIQLLRRKGNFNVAGAAGTAEEALELLPGLEVDLVLVDVSLPGITGIELVSLIRSKYPDLRCLMLSGHTTMHYVQCSLEAGACGYVIKEDVNGIIEGVRRVLEGDIYISQQVNLPQIL